MHFLSWVMWNLASSHRKGEVGLSLFLRSWILQLNFDPLYICVSPPPFYPFHQKIRATTHIWKNKGYWENRIYQVMLKQSIFGWLRYGRVKKKKKIVSVLLARLFLVFRTCTAFEFHLNVIRLYLKVCINFNIELILLCNRSKFRWEFSELNKALLVFNILNVQILQRNTTISFLNS